MIQPLDLDGPAHLSTFRPQQQKAFDWLLASPRRFDLITAPPGVGKSLLGWSFLKLLGSPAVYLTKTNALLGQAEADFGLHGMTKIMGMGRYPCRALGDLMKCDAGPCLSGQECVWRNGGCAYFDQEAKARESQIALTNMSYWLAHKDSLTLGPREVMVIDEAHEIVDELSKAAGAEFSAREIDFPADRKSEDWDWRDWAFEQRRKAWDLLGSETLGPAQQKEVRNLLARFTRLAENGARSAWAWEEVIEKRVPRLRFQPIIPGDFAEQMLFRNIPRIILMSATVRSTHMDALGVPKDQYGIFEADSPFPVSHRPIWFWETGVRVTGKTSPAMLEFWAGKIDQYVAPRLNRGKGIIHTVSYSRAKYLREKSRFGQHMMIHDSDNITESIERFKRLKPPAIFLSPSLDTGWDFTQEDMRWQVIAKVPFPDTRTGIAAARAKLDNQYVQKEAVTKLVQMAGRSPGMRRPQDMGETVIIDDSMKWLYGHFRPWFARWFREAYEHTVMPPPVL